MTNWEKLKQQFKIFAKNFDADNEISVEKKQEFIAYINSIKNQDELNSKAQDYCRDPVNQLLGMKTCKGDEHNCGHVINIEWFKKRLISLLGQGHGKEAFRLFIEIQTCPSNKKDYFIELFCRKVLIEDIYTKENIFKALGMKRIPRKRNHKLCNAKVKPFNCWSFEMDGIDYQDWKSNIDSLPCRLGLENHKYEHQLIKFLLSTKTTLHKPTVFDAGISNELFLPGGKTKPHKECAQLGGLDEWVHPSPTFKEIDYTR